MNKSKIPLIIGLSIPVLMIIFVALSIYLPAMFAAPPKYDFLYITGNNNYCNGQQRYVVKSGKLTDTYEEAKKAAEKDTGAVSVYKDGTLVPARIVTGADCWDNTAVKFFLHDTVKDTNKELSFEDAANLKLDSGVESPDGFEVVRGSSGGDFPFGYSGRNYRNFYLRSDKYSQKVDIKISGQDYLNFQFVGWIE